MHGNEINFTEPTSNTVFLLKLILIQYNFVIILFTIKLNNFRIVHCAQ